MSFQVVSLSKSSQSLAHQYPMNPLLQIPHCLLMPRSPQTISMTIPTNHQLLLRQVRNETQSIQSLDPMRRTLTTLDWLVYQQCKLTHTHSHSRLCLSSQACQRRGTGRTVFITRVPSIPSISWSLLLVPTFHPEKSTGFYGGCHLHCDDRPILWRVRCAVCQGGMRLFRSAFFFTVDTISHLHPRPSISVSGTHISQVWGARENVPS
jgi:hypothetical protein